MKYEVEVEVYSVRMIEVETEQTNPQQIEGLAIEKFKEIPIEQLDWKYRGDVQDE